MKEITNNCPFQDLFQVDEDTLQSVKEAKEAASSIRETEGEAGSGGGLDKKALGAFESAIAAAEDDADLKALKKAPRPKTKSRKAVHSCAIRTIVIDIGVQLEAKTRLIHLLIIWASVVPNLSNLQKNPLELISSKIVLVPFFKKS